VVHWCFSQCTPFNSFSLFASLVNIRYTVKLQKTIIQSKTQKPLSVPLPDDVGWAIIEYIKQSRPKSDFPQIFLRHVPPIKPFTNACGLGGIISRYRTIAGIHVGEKGSRKGMHSLRHTFATRLLREKVPLETIAELLGHVGMSSINVYLSVETEALRQCALSPEGCSAMNKSLREHAEDYIAFKKAGGGKAKKKAMILYRFVAYAEQWEPMATTVTKESALCRENMSPEEAPTNQQSRKGVVIRFSKYILSRGIEAFVYPKFRYIPTTFVPHIFTNEELARFFTACDNTRTPNLVRSDVTAMIFRMLYATGMRLSEAINLTVRDVDLVQGVIRINDAKFDKERLLPIHDELLARMKRYSNKVHAFVGQDRPFYPNVQKEHYSPG
jgi:site-specific recombinase XerD